MWKKQSDHDGYLFIFDATSKSDHAEAANRRLQYELGMHHPTIWKFIDALRKVQKGRDAFLEKLMAGYPPPKKLK